MAKEYVIADVWSFYMWGEDYSVEVEIHDKEGVHSIEKQYASSDEHEPKKGKIAAIEEIAKEAAESFPIEPGDVVKSIDDKVKQSGVGEIGASYAPYSHIIHPVSWEMVETFKEYMEKYSSKEADE